MICLPAFLQLIAQGALNGDLAIACAVLRNGDDWYATS